MAKRNLLDNTLISNYGYAKEWTEKTALSLSSDAESRVAISPADGSETVELAVQTDQDLYFTWSTSDTDQVNTSNSLYLTGGDDIYILPVPLGIAGDDDTIYFHAKRKTSNTTAVRIVEL